jgi:hypothetical protein
VRSRLRDFPPETTPYRPVGLAGILRSGGILPPHFPLKQSDFAAAAILALLSVPTLAEISNPLPDPDGKPADITKPVQVYTLMGQSNMLGFGKINGEKNGTLENAVKNKGKYPEFKGNVATVYSKPLRHGGASNSHYAGNAETYMDVGEAMGRAMVELLENN